MDYTIKLSGYDKSYIKGISLIEGVTINEAIELLLMLGINQYCINNDFKYHKEGDRHGS